MTPRKRAQSNPIVTVLSDPRVWGAVLAALGLAGGAGIGEAKEDSGFERGFKACISYAKENRADGKRKIIPLWRDELVDAVPNAPATEGQ